MVTCASRDKKTQADRPEYCAFPKSEWPLCMHQRGQQSRSYDVASGVDLSREARRGRPATAPQPATGNLGMRDHDESGQIKKSSSIGGRTR